MSKARFFVQKAEFVTAISNARSIKRSPNGGRASIPRDTLFTPRGKKMVLIEAPFKNHLLVIDGVLNEQISVDALQLEKVAKALGDVQRIEVWIDHEMLHVKGQSLLSIPLQQNN